MNIPESRVSTAIAYLITKIKSDVSLNNFFADVTDEEFPQCEEYPACNVNAMSSQDDSTKLGMPLKARVVTMNVFVVLHPDGKTSDTTLWNVIDAIRDIIKADKNFGAVGYNAILEQPVIETHVFTVPSPFGTPLMGCRKIEFEAVLRESNY